MSWRRGQDEARAAYLAACTPAEAARYDAPTRAQSPEDRAAVWEDIRGAIALPPGLAVLDAGAGGGALCLALAGHGLALTALEPAPPFRELLAAKPDLAEVEVRGGFCDAVGDRDLFPAGTFDVVASQKVANELYDPLAAFRNWRLWLKPGGAVVLVDGLFGRDAWGAREPEVDGLPLSANQSRGLVPYLLEAAGFEAEAPYDMPATNARSRYQRYLVVARKPL